MAKGDDKRARNRITEQGGLAQANINNVRSRMLNQVYPTMMNNYTTAVDQQRGDYNNLMGQYGGFAQTGGYSPMDMTNMRNRAMAPNRAIFDSAKRGLDRFGGTGKQAALSRLQRDTGQAMSDTATGTEANLAQMRQQGKLAGLSGMAGMYGSTPGMANMFGNQVLQQLQQQLGVEGLQNQLGLGMMNAQINAGQMPGKWEHGVGRVNDVLKIASSLAMMG